MLVDELVSLLKKKKLLQYFQYINYLRFVVLLYILNKNL